MSKTKTLLKATLISGLLSAGINANAVDVHINSGNPAYPFPQFLSYACGGNLGTNNPTGLVHAEMEQQIRDAYQFHAREFEYTGEEWNGIKYIYTPYKSAYDCTEGDGYALLAAAYMADKVTFDGYWMRTHDYRRVKTKKYIDCTDNAPDYSYGDFAISDVSEGSNTAADGDVDVALALYVAYKQWGEFMLDNDGNKVLDACGSPISYKQELINVVRGLVAMSTRFEKENPRRVNTGMIGLDGYPKGGDSWNEATTWASQSENYLTVNDSIKVLPEFGSGISQHIDYNAPAYYHEFHDLLISLGEELGATNGWEAEQFRRAEASSDWLMAQLIGSNEHAVPTAGWYMVNNDGSETSFYNFNQGEDFRNPLRTISNYVWHGNPSYSWDPVNHKVIDGANKNEYNAAVRLSNYLKDPAHWNDSTYCYSYGSIKIPVGGTYSIALQSDPMTGNPIKDQTIYMNSQPLAEGASSFAAIGVQDYELMANLYRKCYMVWDSYNTNEQDNAIKPKYMQGWFRQLGMMALTGNYAAPSSMKPSANFKLYLSTKDSVSSCHIGDTVTYQISYRNYGSIAAKNITINANIMDNFEILDAANGGIVNGNKVIWTIDSVAGLKSDESLVGSALDFSAPNLSKTVGILTFRLKAISATRDNSVFVPNIDFSCDNNCLGGYPNDYPNYVTNTMQRNFVNVIDDKQIKVEKTADADTVAKGDTINFSISYLNDSLPWLTGGRPDVNVTMAYDKNITNILNVKARIINDAIEPIIDYGNYRLSFFVKSKSDAWKNSVKFAEGIDKSGVRQTIEQISDDLYKLTFSFSHKMGLNTIIASSHTSLSNNTLIDDPEPFRLVLSMNYNNYEEIDSSMIVSDLTTAEDEDLYFPVTPSYQNSINIVSIDKLLKDACDISSNVVENVLVEEYDGQTWRKILGNSLIPNGKIAENIVVTDTLPLGFEFISATDTSVKFTAATDTANYSGIVTYTKNKLYVGQSGKFTYTCRFNGSNATTIKSSSHVADNAEESTSNTLVLAVKDKEKTGIKSIEADEAPIDVYNVQGVLLKHNVEPAAALDGLHKGVYVVGHKKAINLNK